MKYDVVVIGGSAGGLTAAISAKRFYPDKSVLVIKKEDVSMIPCGIPYIFGTLRSVEDDVLPTERFLKPPLGIDVLVDEVTEINPKSKTLLTKSGRGGISWEKLVLATGGQDLRFLTSPPALSLRVCTPSPRTTTTSKNSVRVLKRPRVLSSSAAVS
ncbi:FAD-dependent oxidoreductase [Thermococcus peptonophilus]|uniref:FAD-dependent oxidoreductase n=1 Tax=Thermococcus peptonophilus TaxID=53952 RepID=UPI000B12B9F4